MTTVTEEEMQRPRAASEFRAWVDLALATIVATKEGKKQLRFRTGIAKSLVEEALPLGILCDLYFCASQDVTVQHILGNQNFDALITDKRLAPAPFQYLEITQAHDGENEHLRMLALDRDGHVNSLGKVRKTGTKHTGITVDVENEAKRHSDVLDAELDRIRERLKRKMGKSYRKNTGLLVVFDDYVAIKDSDDIAALERVLREGAQKIDTFCWIGAVGWSGKTFVELKLQ